MHIEIQVALNFVISYLYNKLPRRRVNIFGEELEKALKDKFQGHWYPEKPFKGSAFRCLKTGDPIDAVLERAARESGVPISDILENLPNELSVWVDPGEVSYRIGEKGAVKILYSEHSDNHEENSSADREVNKMFNPEAQCFRPIDTITSNLSNMSLSPKTSPLAGSSPHSAASTSPTYKGSPHPVVATTASSFMQRSQAPLTFTTATFAQTKFGSTKLKTSSKRSNSSSYRMSPTEFSNYIKQRAMQQQLHHGHGAAGASQANHFGPIGPISPVKSQSPNHIPLDPFYFPNSHNIMSYHQFAGHRNIFDTHYHQHQENNGAIFGATASASSVGAGIGVGHSKYNSYLEPHGFYGLGNHLQQQQHSSAASIAAAAVAAAQHQHNVNAKNIINSANIGAGDSKDSIAVNLNGNPGAIGAGCVGANNNVGTNITITVSGTAANGSGNAMSPVPHSGNSASTSNAVAIAGNGGISSGPTNGPNSGPNPNGQTSQDNANNSSKIMDGINAFYSGAAGSYHQLLVAN